MGSEWREIQFDQVCDVSRGASPRPIHEWIAQNGIPWVKISDASSANSRYIERTRECIRPEGRSKSVSVYPGDLILSNSATPGIPMFMGIEACIHDGWLLLRNFREFDKRFAYYLLLPERPALVEQGSGSVFTNLKTEILKKHKVRLPPLPEQRAIAHILGTLDDKIELNRRMNETLEAMARALFKSWFVDFDPVRAKAEGRDTGLPQHIVDLFPDSFEDSELGEIPRGWEVKPIGKLADVVGGGTPSTKEPTYWDGSHHWATPKDLSALTFPVLLNTERRISDTGLGKISSGLLPRGTVLLSSRAPIGYLAIAEIPVAINQGFIAMRPKASVSNLFLLLWSRDSQEIILSNANGSTFLEISKKNFRPIPVVTPPTSIMAAFDRIARPLYGRLVSNERASRTLAALRDALLPKLISGELRVPDAEKFIERMTA